MSGERAEELKITIQTLTWAVPSPRPMVEIAPWALGGSIFMVVMNFPHVRFLWTPDPVIWSLRIGQVVSTEHGWRHLSAVL